MKVNYPRTVGQRHRPTARDAYRSRLLTGEFIQRGQFPRSIRTSFLFPSYFLLFFPSFFLFCPSLSFFFVGFFFGEDPTVKSLDSYSGLISRGPLGRVTFRANGFSPLHPCLRSRASTRPALITRRMATKRSKCPDTR